MNLLVEPHIVRDIAGISDTYDVSDEALARLIDYSQRYARKDICYKIFDEKPLHNPDTGEGFDGDNTTFQTRNAPIFDATMDETTDSDDITGYWLDSDWGVNDCSISVTNAHFGIIAITQDDGSTAIPNTTEGVFITYYHEPDNFDIEQFVQAVAYLAADRVLNMLRSQDKLNLADIEANKQLVKVAGGTLFFDMYRDIARNIGFPAIRGR